MNVSKSTHFTAPPEWQWLVACYFFFGGLAGGLLFSRCVDRLVRSHGRSSNEPPLTGEREAPPDCVFVGRRGRSSKSRGKAAPEARDRRAYARALLFGINDFVKLALRRLLQ